MSKAIPPRGGQTPRRTDRHRDEPPRGGARNADPDAREEGRVTVATNEDDDRRLTAYLDGELDEVSGRRSTRGPSRPHAGAGSNGTRAANHHARPSTRCSKPRRSPRCGRGTTPPSPLLRRAPRRHGERRAPRSPPQSQCRFRHRRRRWTLERRDRGSLAETRRWRKPASSTWRLHAEKLRRSGSPRLGAKSRRCAAARRAARVDRLEDRRAVAAPRRTAAIRRRAARPIGYLDGATPVALCILRDGEADAPLASSSRDGFAVASWAQGGRGYMLIGKIPVERLTTLARSLKEKTG